VDERPDDVKQEVAGERAPDPLPGHGAVRQDDAEDRYQGDPQAERCQQRVEHADRDLLARPGNDADADSHRLATQAVPRPLATTESVGKAWSACYCQGGTASDSDDMAGESDLGIVAIVGELHKLGIDIAKSTMEKYRVRPYKPQVATGQNSRQRTIPLEPGY
jgi:hypothetical protein